MKCITEQYNRVEYSIVQYRQYSTVHRVSTVQYPGSGTVTVDLSDVTLAPEYGSVSMEGDISMGQVVQQHSQAPGGPRQGQVQPGGKGG